MTYFLNFRSAAVGGSVISEPYLLQGTGQPGAMTVTTFGWNPPPEVAGREVVFATHGFNVSYRAGVDVLAQLERDLQLSSASFFIGVLWPGDYWIPAINYPTEAEDAVQCGRALAAYANKNLSLASGISFVSHSLGGRLVLEAVKHLDRPVREVCVMAAAVDDDCMARAQYADARKKASRVSVLASTKDAVLRVAYVVGDFVSDVFLSDDDSPWRPALGYHGPRPGGLEHVAHAQIPEREDFGHGDYLQAAGSAAPKPAKATTFVRKVLDGLPAVWP